MQWMPTLLDAYFESFHHTNGITSGRIRSINGRCRFTVEEGGRDQPADPRTFEIRSKVVAFPLGGGDKDELLRLRHDVTELRPSPKFLYGVTRRPLFGFSALCDFVAP